MSGNMMFRTVLTALLIAFPMRETTHFLGDTQVRMRAMAIFSVRLISVTMTEWTTRLHATGSSGSAHVP